VQHRTSADRPQAVPDIIVGDVVPMLLTLSSPPATRLRQLLVLLLLALGLLAGVSVSQSRDAEAQAIHTEAVLLPALQRLQRDTIRSGPIRLRVYGVEKTLVDCFRHRSRLGMEVVLEALRDASSQRRINVDELWRQAKAQRMQRVIAPYLEALL
jgi:hypothetical protein